MATKTVSLITSRDDKGLAITRLFDDTFNKAKLDEEGAQRLWERGGEAQAEWLATIRKFSASNQYANQVVRCTRTYPLGFAVKPIRRQVEMLADTLSLSPDRAFTFIDQAVPKITVPDEADGWYAFATVDGVAGKHFPDVTGDADRYCRGVQLILDDKLASSRDFTNWRKGQLGPDRLRQHVRSVSFWKRVSEQQPGDIAVLPGQFGKLYGGMSVLRVRELLMGNQFGAGWLAGGCMLLTHPERITDNGLFVDFPGDEYSLGADGQFDRAPYFRSNGGQVETDADSVDDPYGLFGSASLWFPQ
ncbi:MAG: hypothetical protein HY420_04925 [Candidatus Kerfeldbacteria bacterium]|nr:hypothetical protein [Candidatus Kerfeldbacteria bacterium]